MATNKHRPIPPLRQSDVDRFWKYVDVRGPNECWPWIGARFGQGYGALIIRPYGNLHSNRLAYFITKGIDPGPLCVCHSCDFPPCCNPQHLWLGTVGDNHHDMRTKGRGKDFTGERNPKARFSPSTVLDIRAAYSKGQSIRSLSIEHQTSFQTIWRITKRQIWKHIP